MALPFRSIICCVLLPDPITLRPSGKTIVQSGLLLLSSPEIVTRTKVPSCVMNVNGNVPGDSPVQPRTKPPQSIPIQPSEVLQAEPPLVRMRTWLLPSGKRAVTRTGYSEGWVDAFMSGVGGE